MSIQESQSGAPTGSAKLNIVFHGLWAFETTKGGPIIAYTPKVSGHTIVAGSRTKLVNLEEGKDYVLVGVEPQDPKDFDFTPGDNVVVTKKPFIGKETLFCTVKLDPVPTEIQSVRLVNVKGNQVFGGANGKDLHPYKAAMVQVFIYDVAHPEAVSLQPADAKPTDADTVQPTDAGKDDAWNLHIFAQPSHLMDAPPPVDHYAVMAKMFGLDITAIKPVYTKPLDPGIPGLTEDDTKGLDEPVGPPPPHSGSNCDGLIIDNHELADSPGK